MSKPVGRSRVDLALELLDRMVGRQFRTQSPDGRLYHEALELLRQALQQGVFDDQEVRHE